MSDGPSSPVPGNPPRPWAGLERERGGHSPFTPRYWDLKERALAAAPDPESAPSAFEHRPQFADWPTDRDDFWRRVDRFIDSWWPTPLTRASGISESEWRAAEARLGTPLPRALAEWHRLAGLRRDVWDPPDPDGEPYAQPDVWGPASFLWLGEERPRLMLRQYEDPLADRFHPLIVSVLHGPCQSNEHAIRHENLGLDDPPVTDYNALSCQLDRPRFASITRMAASLLFPRAADIAAARISFVRELTPGRPDLSEPIEAATARRLWHRCAWSAPFFDVSHDANIVGLFEGVDCLALRQRVEYLGPDPPGRDILTLAFRTHRAARAHLRQLGWPGDVPGSWPDPTSETIVSI